MDFWFLFKCFVIGIFAASGLGPIFVLTFNRAAMGGFVKGFLTAFGAASADSLFFLFGLVGILTLIGDSITLILTLDFLGGTLLIFFGFRALKKVRQFSTENYLKKRNPLLIMLKGFFLTAVNPLVLLFFMVISIQVMPNGISDLTVNQMVISCFMVLLGSLTVLTGVALIGTFLGSCISSDRLKLFSILTGVVFIASGIYLMSQFFMNFIKIYKL